MVGLKANANKTQWGLHSRTLIRSKLRTLIFSLPVTMTESRRQKIEAMLKDDPEDITLQYMLAMEWSSENDNEKSLALYQKLMALQPPHIDSFFRFAQQKVSLGEIAPARKALREGIRFAREQDRLHTAAEMSELLQSLGEHGDS